MIDFNFLDIALFHPFLSRVPACEIDVLHPKLDREAVAPFQIVQNTPCQSANHVHTLTHRNQYRLHVFPVV